MTDPRNIFRRLSEYMIPQDSAARGLLKRAFEGAHNEQTVGTATSASEWANIIVGADGRINEVIPSRGRKRVVELQTESAFSTGASICVGYSYFDPKETGQNAGISERFFTAQISFGAGSQRRIVEVDVTEGNHVSVYGDEVTVEILDYSIEPTDEEVQFAYQLLENGGHGSYLPGNQRSVVTQRAYRVCNFDFVPPASGPIDAEEWLRQAEECLLSVAGFVCPTLTAIAPPSIPSGSELPVALTITGTGFTTVSPAAPSACDPGPPLVQLVNTTSGALLTLSVPVVVDPTTITTSITAGPLVAGTYDVVLRCGPACVVTLPGAFTIV